jgi:hypothetical protein
MTATLDAGAEQTALDIVSAMLRGEHGELSREVAQEAGQRAWQRTNREVALSPSAVLAEVNRQLLRRITELLVETGGNMGGRLPDVQALLAALARGLGEDVQ